MDTRVTLRSRMRTITLGIAPQFYSPPPARTHTNPFSRSPVTYQLCDVGVLLQLGDDIWHETGLFVDAILAVVRVNLHWLDHPLGGFRDKLSIPRGVPAGKGGG